MNENEHAPAAELLPAPADLQTAGTGSPRDSAAEADAPLSQAAGSTAVLRLAVRRGIPLLLSLVTAVVTVCCALNAVLSAGVSEESITRLFLSGLAGGCVSVRPLSSSALPDPLPPVSPPESDKTEPSAAAGDPDVPTEPALTRNVGSSGFDPLPNEALSEVREPALTDETGYAPDLAAILAMPRPIEPLDVLLDRYGSDAPIVLILHTHATEAYADCPDYRSEDNSRNVTSVGAALADLLNGAGIPTIHDETPFDLSDFTMAYYSASRAIQTCLASHPSIRYILDLYRDSVRDEDGNELAFTCETEEGPAARLMFVIGTDDGGADHPRWRDNLALAARLHLALSEPETLMRPLNLRSASFNEQYSPGSLLLEVGSAGNTREEALRSAAIFAEALIREIRGGTAGEEP